MTYDSPFWAIEGEVIPEVANFKQPQNDDRDKKIFWNFVDPCRELNQGNLDEMPQYWPLHYPEIFIRRNVF
jgi:hypothetical protein